MGTTGGQGLSDDSRSSILDDLRQRKRNRTLAEVEAALLEFGFQCRDATKEGKVWSRGSVTLTLPSPHGRGDKSLHPKYVSLVVRKIEEAMIEVEGQDPKAED